MLSPLGTGAVGLGRSLAWETVELWVLKVCNWGGGSPSGAAVLKTEVGLEWGWTPQQLQSHPSSPWGLKGLQVGWFLQKDVETLNGSL